MAKYPDKQALRKMAYSVAVLPPNLIKDRVRCFWCFNEQGYLLERSIFGTWWIGYDVSTGDLILGNERTVLDRWTNEAWIKMASEL